jgi:L,D-transpeptidase YcbB
MRQMQNGFARASLSLDGERANLLQESDNFIDRLRPDGAIERRKPGKRGKVLTLSTVGHAAGRLLAGSAVALMLAAAGLALSPRRAIADPPAAAPPAAAPVAAAPATTAPGAPDGAAGLPTLTPFKGDVAVEDRLDPSSRLTIADERLHDHLLRRFYLAHGYRMVWDSRPIQAAAMWQAVLHAGGQGLDPALFHSAALSEHWTALSPVERDLLLSDAFLGYADALARGAMPIEERDDDEDLTPAPIDVVATLDAAIAAPDPAAAVEALAPSSPEYVAMRRAYAAYRAIAEGGHGFGRSKGLPLRQSAADASRRARQLAINLERLRWLPRDLPADRLVVDTAIAQLQLFRDNRPVFTTRVVAGEFDKQTPELQSVVSGILFNPPWNVPRSIVEKEILPKLAGDHHYLAEHHMRWRGPMAVQQEAGPYSSLGRLKFEMADRFDVYLHDTPEKWRFAAANRMMSHGCVRVENPRALAALLLGQGPEAVDRAIDVNHTHLRALPAPIPVFIVYRTAFAESDGAIAFRADPYQRDDGVWTYLNRAQQPPMAQDIAAGQRKG